MPYDFTSAALTMEGLVNLSPGRMQSLLETTNSIKVKRLFFFFADRHHHRWLNRIDRNKIDMGKGKRMLVKGGKYLPEYRITVPEDFEYMQGRMAILEGIARGEMAVFEKRTSSHTKAKEKMSKWLE